MWTAGRVGVIPRVALSGMLVLLSAVIATAAYPPPLPTALVMTVGETAGIARSGEVVRSGVPLPRSLNVRSTTALTVVDAGGTPVPAQFEVLARWDAGRTDPSRPIQWLLVTFPATVGANGAATYRLVTDGSAGPNPAPPVALTLTQVGNRVTVSTGAAVFVLGGSSETLFDEIRLGSGTRVVSASALTARANASDTTHPTLRAMRIERAGPLAAVIVVDGAYGMAPVGGGGLASQRRYVFTAGSPTAIVRHSAQWEGDLCGAGNIECGAPNGVRVERVRDALTLDLGTPLSVTAVGDFEAAALQGTAQAGQTASVRQLLRTSRTASLAFDVQVPGTAGATGQKADGGVLAVSGSSGSVALALYHMHRYEPQALRLLVDGRLAVDIVDAQAWLGARQGLFATLAVGALPSGPQRDDLDRLVWAPLNRPLRAWPSSTWFANSGVVDEFPVGALPSSLAAYDTLVPGVLNDTLQKTDAKGLAGIMTFGVYPRYWGSAVYGDELDCGGDPTPGETWDDLYWCATWTDYHNTLTTAPIWAMRSGEVEWLDEIAFPGALRTLHTQILRCAPGDAYFYCGQAPAGYGGYRSDVNSSHAYFDNLFLYYWLSGDSTVVETLKRGATSMRNYLCFRRPGAACLPDDPPSDFWAQLTGRVASQWFSAFRFVGLASDDPSFLEDWKSGLARAATQHAVLATQNAREYAFWLYGGDPVTGPGSYSTDQLWMVSLYDTNNLNRLRADTADAPIGNPAVPPGRILDSWARTLVDFGSTTAPGGNGTPQGDWPNALDFTWAGGRVGGSLSAVSANVQGGDPLLYDNGKACLTAAVVRSGQRTGDSAVMQMGSALTNRALATASSELMPLGKIQGLYLSRLHAAVARLVAPSPTFSDVPAGHWALPFIEGIYAAQITRGCGTALYCPEQIITRGQMAVFLLRASQGALYTPPPATGLFADVPPSHPFAAWIEELYRRGITSGCGSGNFCPGSPVTRAQMAVFLLRALEGASYVPPPATGVFADVPPNDFFAPWIEEIARRGITTGCGSGNYCPRTPVTRAQMAVFLVRAFSLPPF